MLRMAASICCPPPGSAPRRRERARLEESRDRLRLQEASAANTHRRLLPRLFHPQADGVLDRRRLGAGSERDDKGTNQNDGCEMGARANVHR